MNSETGRNAGRARLVRQERESRAWSQEQLAEIAEISIRTIQRLESSGSGRPETLMAVAQAFGMDIKQMNQASRNLEDVPAMKHSHLMPRIFHGSELAYLVRGSDEFVVEHDEDSDPRSVEAMKGVLNLLKQDIVRLYDANQIELPDVESELSREISGLESCGYFLFGVRRVIPRVAGEQMTLISMTVLFMSHIRSLKIVRSRGLMVLPAFLPEGAGEEFASLSYAQRVSRFGT